MVQLITDFIHAANLKLVDALPIIGKTFELCQLVGENKLVEYQSNGNSSIVLTDKHGLFTAWTREGAASTESLKELLSVCDNQINVNLPIQLYIVGKRSDILCDDSEQLDRLGIQTTALLSGQYIQLRKAYKLIDLSLFPVGYQAVPAFLANTKFMALRVDFELEIQTTTKCFLSICNQY
jgi:hypothetical protein